MRNKFIIKEVDEFDNSYFEVDVRNFMKKVLRLSITSSKTFDSVVDLFDSGDLNKIQKLQTFLYSLNSTNK